MVERKKNRNEVTRKRSFCAPLTVTKRFRVLSIGKGTRPHSCALRKKATQVLEKRESWKCPH